MGSEVVGVKPTNGGSTVAEMVATGDAIRCVAVGAADSAAGGGVSTWTLNVQPETRKIGTGRNAMNLFKTDPFTCCVE